jgi:hypothetical protein
MSTISYRFIEHFYLQFEYKTYLRQNQRNRGSTVTFFNILAYRISFCTLPPLPDRLWGPPSFSNDTGAPFPGVSRLGPEVEHPPPSKNERTSS